MEGRKHFVKLTCLEREYNCLGAFTVMHVILAAAVVKIEDIPPEWNQPVSEEGLQAASSGMNIPLEQLTSTVALELPDTRQCWAYRSVAATVADAAPVCITSEEQWADRRGEVNLIHSKLFRNEKPAVCFIRCFHRKSHGRDH